jgi:glycosyltransferase involved in cell wall biosynthesis
MRVLIVTDAFPPRCGGSGWSTFHLTQALARAGHEVRVIQPVAGRSGIGARRYEDVDVTEFGYVLHDLPYVRSVLRDEVMARRLAAHLVRELRERPADVVHAQHALSASPAIVAGRAVGAPVVVTVRDYWPTCYFTTASVDGAHCPQCGFRGMLRCMKEKSPRAYWAGIPLMPYMRRNVRRKQERLRQAAAVIAVSRYVADVVVRPLVGASATHVIPNSIAVDEVRRAAEDPPTSKLPDRFLLFAGKLNALKGAEFALDVLSRIRHSIPLVMVGEGPRRPAIERRAREQHLNVQVLPWVDNREVWRIMRRATLVLVPSLWSEPLSRAVTEAMAAGAPVAATDRGGIHDQIEHRKSGLVLPADAERFAEEVDGLLDDPVARERYVLAARRRAEDLFDDRAVLPRIEELYRSVSAGVRPS